MNILFYRMSDIVFKMLLWHAGLKNDLVLERAGHIPLGLVVLQFCKLIYTSPMFPILWVILYNTASLPLVISIKALPHRIWLMQILSLISFNLCSLLSRQIKRCVVPVLFVAGFCWHKRAFYVLIVGAMGIKSVDG